MHFAHLFVPLQLFSKNYRMKRLVMSLLVGLMVLVAQGQMVNPVHFSSQLKKLKGNEGEIVFSATVDDGWHVYSTDMGNDGPISATFNVVKMEGAEPVGKLTPRGKKSASPSPNTSLTATWSMAPATTRCVCRQRR